jgi:FlaA1/EpsC-like NDP-sugar epimerase
LTYIAPVNSNFDKVVLVGTRLSFRIFHRAFGLLSASRRKVLLVGAGREADEAVRYLSNDSEHRVSLIGLVDNDPFRQGKLIRGLPVLGSTGDLERIYDSANFTEIVVTNTALPPEQVEQIENFSNRHLIPILNFRVQLKREEPAGPDRSKVSLIGRRERIPSAAILS